MTPWVLLQTTSGIALTDQGLIGLFGIFAIAIFGCFGYTALVHRENTAFKMQLQALQQSHDTAVRKIDRFFDVIEMNAINSVLGVRNPLNEEQQQIADRMAAEGSSKQLADHQLELLIVGLDLEKDWLEAQLKLDYNPLRVEQSQKLADVKQLLGSLNARLDERRFVREMEEGAAQSGLPKRWGLW